MRIKTNHGFVKMLALLAALLLAVAGCSSSGGGGTATPVTPTGTDPAAITLVASPGTIPAGGTATITARVVDEDGAVVPRETVTFSVDSLYGTITATADTDTSGVATATFTSSGQTGTATITGSVGSAVTGSTTVTITPVAAYLSLSTSRTSIPTDGTTAAVITATVLDASRVPIEGLAVNFSVAAGQLSAANVLTDANGQAAINFTSGFYEKANQVATITATVQDQIATIPIQITGTTVTLTIGVSEIPVAGATTDLTITVKDGGSQAISGAAVTITQSSSNGGSVTLSAESGVTDTTGVLTVTVRGQSAGTVTLTVSCLGVTKTQTVTVSGTPFEITSPTSSSVSRATGSTLSVTVRSPLNHDVKFVTSMGTWASSGSAVATVASAGTVATDTLNVGPNAGIATVRVEDVTNSAINDTLLVAVYAPAVEAAKLSLQVSPSTIPPSGGGVTNSATIKATVLNNTDNVVGNAPVTFTLFRTTGGGEYVSPPIVYTASNGQATTQFYSGSLVTNTNAVLCLGRINGSAVAGPSNMFTFSAAGSTITRGDGGSFVADGFAAGNPVRITGSDHNDGDSYT
ncbi:MAG: Ig-like domain-containing protein, partial [Thermodesulfobacteriota bacterium]